MRKSGEKAEGLGCWLPGAGRRRFWWAGRGSWRGRRLGHAKAVWVEKTPALPEAAARVKPR